MTEVPAGLAAIIHHAPLSVAALLAAAEQQPLIAPLSRRSRLPDTVVRRVFLPGARPHHDVALALVDRKLSARTVRHVVRTAGERRPEVIAALVRRNVPAKPDRAVLVALSEPVVDEAVLTNGRWPVDEQLDLVRRVGGTAALRWLAHLDPAVHVTWDDLAAVDRTSERFDAEPVTALHALLRRPWLSGVPLDKAGTGFRSAIATVTADERTLFRLLGTAQHLARFGRRADAAAMIEAIACNPSASLTVQRRCRRLARRIRCHYLADWLPARGTRSPLWQADPDGQRTAMDRLEQLEAVRHRTVWSAGLLAGNPQLVDDVRDRIVTYLDRHLAAVDAGGRSVDVLADRLEVDADTRQRWHERCQPPTGRSVAAQVRPGGADHLEVRQRPWGVLVLSDCGDPATARRVARRLTQAFGRDQDAWIIAFLLLREGWDAPLAELAPVVAALVPDQEVAA